METTTDTVSANGETSNLRTLRNVLAALLSFGVILVVLAGIGGCTPTNKADTGKIALSHSETVYDANTGKPLKTVADEGTSSGPSATGNLDAVKLTDGPAAITLPSGGSVKSDGGWAKGSFFKPTSGAGHWILILIGALCLVGGVYKGYLAATTPPVSVKGIGQAACAMATGVFLIWGGFDPEVLWVAALPAVIYIAYEVWRSKQAAEYKALANAAATTAATSPPLASVLDSVSDRASAALARLTARKVASGGFAPVVPVNIPTNPPTPATLISTPTTPASAIGAAFPGASVTAGPSV